VSIRIDASGDYLRLTSNLPSVTAFTQCCWYYHVSDRSNYAFFMGPENAGGTEWALLGFNNSNQLGLSSNTGNSYESGTLTPGTWHFAALTGNTDNLRFYHWPQDGTLSYLSVNPASISAVADYCFGADNANEWVDGRLAGMKMWGAALSQSELELEMQTIRPARFANLYGWWPGFPGASERLLDYSGNGRDLTAGGILTDESSPPVSWGSVRSYLRKLRSLQLRGHASAPFAQDDSSPAWEDYSGPVVHDWRYIQVRELT
jgi:hypothetical protein